MFPVCFLCHCCLCKHWSNRFSWTLFTLNQRWRTFIKIQMISEEEGSERAFYTEFRKLFFASTGKSDFRFCKLISRVRRTKWQREVETFNFKFISFSLRVRLPSRTLFCCRELSVESSSCLMHFPLTTFAFFNTETINFLNCFYEKSFLTSTI